jgi:hypothetical protein
MGIAIFLAGPVCAKVTGVCVNCHTMHNSQDNAHMIINTSIDGTSGGDHGGGYPSLTRGSCVGCHTGVVDGGPTPFVNSSSEPTQILAGGNFYWVAQGNDAKGHNVLGIANTDGDLIEAPGNPNHCADSCHYSLATTDYNAPGCQGCHLEPKHHAPQQADGTPAKEANGYFRFLAGHMSGSGFGVEGFEDPDWQYTVSATDHNEYCGWEEHLEWPAGLYNLGNTMTAYCCGCHGNFHIQRDGEGASANWIRHPSDAVIPNSGEYSAYTVYNPIAPVARPDLSTIGDTAAVRPGTDLVMCLSCHRAHGSPNDDLLRWEYDGMVAGGGGADGTGCFVCHTEKDG